MHVDDMRGYSKGRNKDNFRRNPNIFRELRIAAKEPGEKSEGKKKKNLLYQLWHMAHRFMPLPLSNNKLVTASTNTVLQKGRCVTPKAGSSFSPEHSYSEP